MQDTFHHFPLFERMLALRQSGPPGEMQMHRVRHKKWLLIIFSPSAAHPDYVAFKRELGRRGMDLVEHDILVMEALEDGRSRVGDTDLDMPSVMSVRRHFGARDGEFSIVLADREGRVLFEARHAEPLDEILGLIHHVPLR